MVRGLVQQPTKPKNPYSGLDTSYCQVVAQRASSFRQLLALSLVIQVLSVHSIKGECNFFVAPMASIPGDLLALSDFYWPRANGPVLVSNPAYSIIVQGLLWPPKRVCPMCLFGH